MSSVGGRDTSFSEGSGRLRTASAGAGTSTLASGNASALRPRRRRYQKNKQMAAVRSTSAPTTAPARAPLLVPLEFPELPVELLATHVKVAQVLQSLNYQLGMIMNSTQASQPTC